MYQTDIYADVSAKKENLNIIHEQNKLFLNNPLLKFILNAIPDLILILNKERQIVYANHKFKSMMDKIDFELIPGMRFGELLNCEHSSENGIGCGTNDSCKACGSFIAILNSQKNSPDVQECRITRKDNMEALDLRVYATPFPYEGHQFTFFVITDISNEKRRLMLEKIFLHDIVNSAVSIKEATKIIAESEPDKMPEFMEILLQSSDSLLEEITTHREIASIESNELYVNISEFNTFALLNKVSGMFPTIQQDKNVSVKIDNVSVDFILHTDKVLLRRVIGNMIKNALEASPGGETVTIGCSILDGKAIFRVHNNNFIPLNLQLQIFQRSFTTKGTGHGIGTYSIKILTEKYLKGKASFTSSEKDGTDFTVSIPTVLK